MIPDCKFGYRVRLLERKRLHRIQDSPSWLIRTGCFTPRIAIEDRGNSILPLAANRQSRLEPFRSGRNLPLKIGKTGPLNTFTFDNNKVVTHPNLASGEVQVKVPALALNFRDVAVSVGIIEAGKRSSIYGNSMLDMDPFRRNTFYASVDFITLFPCTPPLLGMLVHPCRCTTT